MNGEDEFPYAPYTEWFLDQAKPLTQDGSDEDPDWIEPIGAIKGLNAMTDPLPSGSPPNQRVTHLLDKDSSLAPNRVKTAFERHALFAAYDSALNAFLNDIGFDRSRLPLCLENPPLCFYSRKGHTKQIFSFVPFPYGQWQIKKVSLHTFPSLLRHYNILAGNPVLRTALFEALSELVRKYPYNERDALIKNLIEMDPPYAAFLLQSIAVSNEGNLYFCQPEPLIHSQKPFFTLTPVLSPQFPVSQKVHKKALKQYLTAVAKNPKEQKLEPQQTPTQPEKSILFYGRGNNCQQVSSTADLVVSDVPTPIFPTKALPYLKPPVQVPPGAANWLFHLTGGDTEQVDQLARLLARAASNTVKSRNMTVVCTRANPDVLRSFLNAILSPLVLTSDLSPGGRTMPSLNQFCRTNNLLKLYYAQGRGQGVAFVRDIDVSNTAIGTLDKLLDDKPIPLSAPFLPKQRLFNKIHFICISENPQQARKLSQALNVPLIDLSSDEIPLHDPAPLSARDTAWLRSVFLPYGLVEHQKASKTKKAPKPSDWVLEFLEEYCQVDTSSRCHREDLYQAYAFCYRYTHPGLEPPLSQGQLVKAVKLHLGEGAFKNVNYCKIRSEQKMYFVGLSCPVDLPAPAPIPTQPHTNAFTTHLEHIHSMQPKISLQPYEEIQVKVISFPIE